MSYGHILLSLHASITMPVHVCMHECQYMYMYMPMPAYAAVHNNRT